MPREAPVIKTDFPRMESVLCAEMKGYVSLTGVAKAVAWVYQLVVFRPEVIVAFWDGRLGYEWWIVRGRETW